MKKFMLQRVNMFAVELLIQINKQTCENAHIQSSWPVKRIELQSIHELFFANPLLFQIYHDATLDIVLTLASIVVLFPKFLCCYHSYSMTVYSLSFVASKAVIHNVISCLHVFVIRIFKTLFSQSFMFVDVVCLLHKLVSCLTNGLFIIIISGTANSVNEEVKRVLTNNNASPKTARRTRSNEEQGESSDTQSMEAMSPTRGRPKIDDAAFPREQDKALLMDLIGAKPLLGPPRTPEAQTVEVKRVSSQRYAASDSSSDEEASNSAPSSPQFSLRTDSMFDRSESVRSSLRSTSAQSSEGRITLVTDNASVISDISTAPPSMAGAGGVSPGQSRRPMLGASPTAHYAPAGGAYAHSSSGSPDAGYGNSKSSSFHSDSVVEQHHVTVVKSRGRSDSSSSSDSSYLPTPQRGQRSSRTPTPEPSPAVKHKTG